MSAEQQPLSVSLRDNQKRLEEAFDDCSDIRFRRIRLPAGTEALLVYLDGIVQKEHLQDNALMPLLQHLAPREGARGPEALRAAELPVSRVRLADQMAKVVDAVLDGQGALLIDGYAQAALLDVKGGNRRSVEEPPTEAAIRGPREGFTEAMGTNTALLRFKIKNANLKMRPYIIGRETQTGVVLAYIKGLADPAVIAEVDRRLRRIEIDGVLESGYIEELIEDEPWSPFPQLHNTERPDTVAGNLLEGRFAILVDGTPFALIGPVTFWSMLQASEDYYERYIIGTFIRWLRYLFVGIALFLPATYVAVATFHQDMLPTTLLLSMAAARETIPFPALVEAVMMEVSFEALREASVRLPRTVGQAVSILGALVIGQSAVQAGIVSAPMVIIVSLTGIASFTVPRFNTAIAIRLLRFPMMFLASAFGLFGMVIGATLLAVHVCGLRSFGVPYMAGLAPMRPKAFKDILARAPWWQMVLRPPTLVHGNRQRMSRSLQPGPPESRR